MEFLVEKPKPPKGRGYALRTSMLDEIVRSMAGEVQFHLVYWTPQGDGPFFEAFYWMPNENVAHRRVYVRGPSLPHADLSTARAALVSEVLPGFRTWLQQLNRLPDDAPALQSNPVFDARIAAERRIRIRSRP